MTHSTRNPENIARAKEKFALKQRKVEEARARRSAAQKTISTRRSLDQIATFEDPKTFHVLVADGLRGNH